MDNIAQNKSNLQSLLSSNTSFGVVVSDKQDVDVLAASLSLHLILQDSGKNSQIISRKDPIVEHSFLVGIDQLKKSFGGTTKNLTVSFPYVEGEIEKVSYNIEGDRLNVNLFGTDKGIKFDEKSIRYLRQGSSPQAIVVLGVSNLQEIEGATDPSAQIVNIDNNVSNALFGNIVLVDPSYSSLSEMVARLAFDLGLVLEFDVAQNLLDGILFATNNFTSPKTSPLAFEMAGLLMQKGAIRKITKEARPSTDTSLSMLQKKQSQSQLNNPQQLAQDPSSVQRVDSFTSQNSPFSDLTNDRADMKEVSGSVMQDNSQAQPGVSRPNTSRPDISQLNNSDTVIPEIPTEDQAPSDWFTPKVFKSNKPQE